MSYTNSSLTVYTKLSPNNSGQRTHTIDRISPHCVVGQCTAESLGSWFAESNTQASSNYGIDKNGRVGLYVEEKNRSWCTSSNANDQRAVTIECASDTTSPYKMNDKVYAKLIELCTDICKRNGKTKLLWFADKNKSLAYEPKSDEMLITVHRWFANKACPGDWLYSRLGEVANKVTEALTGTVTASAQAETTGLQAAALKDLTEAQVVEKVGALFTENQKKSGILAAVSMAQFILESGYGKTDLAQNANNCFGMKKKLSGNSWNGSTWDGTSVYTKQTKEQKADGTEYTITADFRKYPDIEHSIADHSAYLLGAMNGSKKRYAGLTGETDYKKAIQIIKDGGYATDTAYVSKICSIIEKWNLTQYDAGASAVSNDSAAWYRVRKEWEDADSQKGAFHDLSIAKECANENPGYSVYDENGKALYTSAAASKVPYAVKVKVSDLNIRTGAGTNYAKTGKCTGKGTFTIVEEAKGQIDSKGSIGLWGKLKSGTGWICLAFDEYTETETAK